MHRTTIALASAIMLSAALLSAQAGKAETKYRGCLVPGSSQGNYLLNNAVAKGDKGKTKVSLKVIPATAKVDLEAQVTHEVEITGTVAPGASGQPGTLTATKISWKADYCG